MFDFLWRIKNGPQWSFKCSTDQQFCFFYPHRVRVAPFHVTSLVLLLFMGWERHLLSCCDFLCTCCQKTHFCLFMQKVDKVFSILFCWSSHLRSGFVGCVMMQRIFNRCSRDALGVHQTCSSFNMSCLQSESCRTCCCSEALFWSWCILGKLVRMMKSCQLAPHKAQIVPCFLCHSQHDYNAGFPCSPRPCRLFCHVSTGRSFLFSDVIHSCWGGAYVCSERSWRILEPVRRTTPLSQTQTINQHIHTQASYDHMTHWWN